jgi:hypothetical protein
MSNSPVFSVEIHREALIDTLNNFEKGYFSCLNQQMYMIAHQDIGMKRIAIALLIVAEYF